MDLQAPPGRQVPRRPGDDVGRRQVHVRPPLREVAGQVRLHRRRQGGAGGQVRRQVHDQGAVRGDARGARRLLGLHHQRGGDQEARGSQQGGARHRALHARRLEGGAADGAEAPPELLQEGPALPRRGEPPHHPRRGQYRRGAPHRAAPARVHRGQQELQPPEGREGADRLPQLAPRLRLPQHQRDAGAAQGRPRAPGDQLGGGPRPGHARGRRRLRPAHRARDGAHEAVAAPGRAVDALLQARRRQGEEAPGGRRGRLRVHRQAPRDPDLPDHGLGGAGRRRPAQEDRHHRGDRERRVRGVDQALARQGLRHDDEHDAGLRRSRHRVLPRAPLDEGPELE